MAAATRELAHFLQENVQQGDIIKVAGGCVEPPLSYYLRNSSQEEQIDRRYLCMLDETVTMGFFIPTWDISLEQFKACNNENMMTKKVFDQDVIEAWYFQKNRID
jgi:hypothetical protein